LEVTYSVISFTANLRGWGVDVKDGADRTVCSAGNVTDWWRPATVACAANSLIDLMLGDLETFLKSLNDWSGISDAVKLR